MARGGAVCCAIASRRTMFVVVVAGDPLQAHAVGWWRRFFGWAWPIAPMSVSLTVSVVELS